MTNRPRIGGCGRSSDWVAFGASHDPRECPIDSQLKTCCKGRNTLLAGVFIRHRDWACWQTLAIDALDANATT
jgi:hypothetical protein